MSRPLHPARAASLKANKRHYEGNPCRNGHTRRHTVSGACVTCQADAQRRRRGTIVETVDDLLG